MKWKIKLPIFFVSAHVTISLPYYLGFLTPSPHDNIYSIFYPILNAPVIWIMIPISIVLGDHPLIYSAYWDTFFNIFILTVAWGLLAFGVGALLDRRSRKAPQSGLE